MTSDKATDSRVDKHPKRKDSASSNGSDTKEAPGASLSPPLRSKNSSPKTGPTLALTSPSAQVNNLLKMQNGSGGGSSREGTRSLPRSPSGDLREMRSAPAKPKSLVPITPPCLGKDSKKLRKQGSSEEREARKNLQKQLSEERRAKEDEIKTSETFLQRQLLFDELEDLDERLRTFKADAKSENTSVKHSVKGADTLEKIVSFNKQLRQFKKVHERNKLLTEESLREDSMEEENYIPEIPETKEMIERYTAFDTKVRAAKQKQAALALLERDKRMATVGSLHKTLPRMKKKKRPVSPLVSPSSAGSTTKSTEFLPALAKADLDSEPRKMDNLDMDVVKSLESLNEEIRDTLPWTTPTPGKADSPTSSQGSQDMTKPRSKPAASNGKSFLEDPPVKKPTSSFVKSGKPTPSKGQVSFVKSPPGKGSSVKSPPGKGQKETTFGKDFAASVKSIKETSFVNSSAKLASKEPGSSAKQPPVSGGKSFLDAVASAGSQLKSSGGKSFLDAVESAGNSPFTTTFTSIDMSEDEEERKSKGGSKSIKDTLAEDLLGLAGGKKKTEGNRRLSDVSDSSKEGSVGSPSAVNERAHQKRMKKLETKQAEERQKEKEEEERKVKRSVEENKKKQEQLALDEENRKRRIRIEKLNEADARRRRIAKEKEEDDERRRNIQKEHEAERRKKVEEEEWKLAKEVEQRRKEIGEERQRKIQEEEERKSEEERKKKSKQGSIKESAVIKPTIKISDLSDDDGRGRLEEKGRRTRMMKEEEEEEGREYKRVRNKTANIPIMPQQESPDGKSSSVALSKYNLESQCIVSPIDIDAWMERKNSINKEVLKFQEELLNYEEDSLNPAAAAAGKVTPTNHPVQEGPKPSVFQNGFIPGRNNVQNVHEKTKAISAKEKFFRSEPVGLLNRISDSANNNNRKKNQNTDNSPPTEVLSRKDRANVAYADKQIEEYEKDMEKLIEENKTADVKLAEYEKGMRETEETKDDPDLTLLDLPRKKSVHFEGVSICLSECGSERGSDSAFEERLMDAEIASGLIPSRFTLEPSAAQTEADLKKASVKETQGNSTGTPEIKSPGILVTNSNATSNRKESLDSVDFELIKLGLHKSTEDIRAQYLQKLNIENPRGSSPVPPTPSLLPGCHPAPTTIPETTSSTTGTTPAVTTAAHHFRPLVIASQMGAGTPPAHGPNLQFRPRLTPPPRPGGPGGWGPGSHLRMGPGHMRGPPPYGPRPPRSPLMRGPFPPGMRPRHLVSPTLRSGGRGGRALAGLSPPPRPPLHLFRSPSPTHGLIRITPRHLPPSYRPRHPSPSLRPFPPSPLHRLPGPGPPPHLMRCPRPPTSPRMMLRGSFSPTLRPGARFHGPPGPGGPRFSPLHSPVRYRRYSPISPLRPMMRPPAVCPVSSCGQLATPTTTHHAAVTTASLAFSAKSGHGQAAVTMSRGEPNKPAGRNTSSAHRMLEEGPKLMKETRIVAANFDHTIGVKTPEVPTLTCSDLLSAYRLSQNLTRTRSGAYKYDPADTADIHRRLTVNSRRIFEKLSSPRKESKGPYVPNRDIMKLFTNTPEAREREQLAMENEEFLHRHKPTYRREGEFFSAQNPDMVEKFQTTHEYIKNVYRHSKDNLLPPGDEMADLHDRVKHFCGVKNEELLEKLKVIEERVRNQEWSGRVKDTREKMNKLYDENREFLENMKKRQEQKVNTLLEDNKELLESIKKKAADTKEVIEVRGREFDQMMEKTVCEAI